MKVAIITGTSSGLGKAFAQALLDLGWKVYGISRRETPELKGQSNFKHIAMDLTKPVNRQLLTQEIQEKKINLLVNNAGFCIHQDAHVWDEKNYQSMFSVHYARPVELISTLFPKLANGMVISTLTENTHIGWEGYALYCASKAALLLHMKTFALENPNIRVCNMHPFGVDTPIIDSLDQEMRTIRKYLMKTKDITTVFIELVTGILSLPSGASIFLHNEWELEDTKEISEKMYLYNVDTEVLTTL